MIARLAAIAAETPIDTSGQAVGIWGLASTIVVTVGGIVTVIYRSRVGSKVVREDLPLPPSDVDNAKALTDIARGMVEDIANRLEVVENDLKAERTERHTQERKWREAWHLMTVWVSQAQEAARRSGITLPPPPNSPEDT